MTFTTEQKDYLDKCPAPEANEGHTAEQAPHFGAQSLLWIFGFEGWKPLPTDSEIESVLRAKMHPVRDEAS